MIEVTRLIVSSRRAISFLVTAALLAAPVSALGQTRYEPPADGPGVEDEIDSNSTPSGQKPVPTGTAPWQSGNSTGVDQGATSSTAPPTAAQSAADDSANSFHPGVAPANGTQLPVNTATSPVPSDVSGKVPAGSASAKSSASKPGKDTVPLSMAPTLAPPMQAKIDPGTTTKTTDKKSSPTAAGGVTPGSAPSPIGSAPAATGPAGEDAYPVIGTLETSVFGAPGPTVKIEDRLSKLENAVFRKTFADQSLFDRTERLKATLLGVQQPFDLDPGSAVNRSQFIEAGGQAMQSFYDDLAMRPENQAEVSDEELINFFADLINAERQKFGFAPLSPDALGTKVAKAHVEELGRRGVVSHQDVKGDNPDRRYTLAGGTDLLFESIVSIHTDDPESRKHNRAIVAKLVKTVLQRQDERDSLLAADATGIGFALAWTANKDRVIACSNIITHHGVMQPIAAECALGDKLEVKGAIMEPYKFDRVTVAWEASNGKLGTVADESDEALPYFAPLDYMAFAKSSEHDYSTALTVLRTAGIIAAIAGGVFMPPVALAAPMIAMSGGMGSVDPKPISDIPVKGGVHVDGNVFNAKVPINHEGKDGLYYVTVWASVSKYGKPIPISRRAILSSATPATSESVSAQVEADQPPPKKHKSHNNKNSNNNDN